MNCSFFKVRIKDFDLRAFSMSFVMHVSIRHFETVKQSLIHLVERERERCFLRLLLSRERDLLLPLDRDLKRKPHFGPVIKKKIKPL